MRISSLFLTVAISFLSLPTLATVSEADCPTIDYSHHFGPVRQQGETGWCYAFTAADLIGYAQGLGPDTQVSAFDIVLNYLTVDPSRLGDYAATTNDFAYTFRAMNAERNLLEEKHKKVKGRRLVQKDGGWGDTATLAYNLRGGICTEEQLRSQGPEIDIASRFYFSYKVASLENSDSERAPHEVFRRRKTRFPLPQERDEDDFMYLVRNHNLVKMKSQTLPQTVEAFEPNQKRLTYQESKNENQLQVVDAAAMRACHPRRPLRPMRTAYLELADKEKMMSSLLATLKKSPLAADYDGYLLTHGPSYRGTEGPHLSAVIGMKWDQRRRQCAVKLRNTYGTDCSIYYGPYRESCEAGTIWVPTDDLKSKLRSFFAVKAL